MNVNCPKCGFTYEIDENKIPAGGVDAKCSNCKEIFEVLLQDQILYLRISSDDIYETTLKEVKEWILERRVLDYHEVSKDKIYWIQLKKHPELKNLFPYREESQELNDFDMGFTNQRTDEVNEIKKDSKLDYREYDDDNEVKKEKTKPKSKLVYLIILLLLVIGAYYLFQNKNIFKKWVNKVSHKESKENKYYIKAISILNSSNFPLEYLRAKTLFEKSMKDINKVEDSLAGLSLINSLNLFYYSIDYNVDINIKNRILSIKDSNPEEFKKLESLLLSLNKSINENKNKISGINLFFKNNIKKLEEISIKNHISSTALAVYYYILKNNKELKDYQNKVTTLNKNSNYLDFLSILDKELENSAKLLQELKFKTSKSVIVNYFIAQKYMKNGQYDLALTVFKTVLTLVEKHDNSMKYIDRLKLLLIYKDVLTVKKEKAKKVKKVVKNVFSYKQELNKAWNLLDKGKIFESRKTFKYIIKMRPRLAQAYHGVGETYKVDGDKEEAIYYFDKCLDINPNYEEANLLQKYIDKFSK